MTLHLAHPDPAPAEKDPFRALDQAVHARLADARMGLSRNALALAQADWAWHPMASPGRQAVPAHRAVDLGLQTRRKTLRALGEAPGS